MKKYTNDPLVDELLNVLRNLVIAAAPAHIELNSVKSVRQMGKLLDATKKAKAAIAKAEGKS